MAQTSTPPLLAQIHQASSPAELIPALRALKNEVIGHEQKKKTWIDLGILELVVQTSISKDSTDKQKESREQTHADEPLDEEGILRVQALSIIGSLAHGGPSPLEPLYSASALPAILSNFCPSSNHPLLVLAALRALSNLTESTSRSLTKHPFDITFLSDSLFSPPYITSLNEILNQSSKASYVQSQKSIAAVLISRLCRDERHRSILADSAILHALAANLAGTVASQGMVIPWLDVDAQKEALSKEAVLSGPKGIDLASLLESIAVIVGDSKLRASQFVYSKSMLAALPPFPALDFVPRPAIRAAWDSVNAANCPPRQTRLNALDYFLPCITSKHTGNDTGLTSPFPPLGTQGFFDSVSQSGESKRMEWLSSKSTDDAGLPSDYSPASNEDFESPLIPYLIYLTRSNSGVQRLMASYLLTILYRTGLTAKSRESSMGLLIIPLLVDLLGDNTTPAVTNEQYTPNEWFLKEHTSAVIGKLIVDSEYLQEAAYKAGIIHKLASMIKYSYESVPTEDETQWTPNGHASSDEDALVASQTSQPGQKGFPPLLVHRMRVREGALRAIAALTPFKDEYRKSLIEQGVMPYIVESLTPYPEKPSAKVHDRNEKVGHMTISETASAVSGLGINSIPVLIAACTIIRHLSRSPSILRTTLVDMGIVMPIFNLLNYPDVEVQTAATATVCNIVTDVSPMRETISAAGVLKVLCRHAHSANMKMRVNALWALKHLVQAASNDIKKTCLEELGKDWLVQLICEDTGSLVQDIEPSTDIGHDDDVSMDFPGDYDNGHKMAECTTDTASNDPYSSEVMRDLPRSKDPTSSATRLIDSRLSVLRDMETNPMRRTKEDYIAVQEQGLDFIRNLIGGFSSTGTAENSDMIDFLYDAYGQDRIFEIFASKLRPKVLNPPKGRNSSDGAGNSETITLQPRPEIIVAVEYVLVHIAASVPRHRQQLIAQTELLRLLLTHFNHAARDVRSAFCWLVINFTWIDDDQDIEPHAQRTQQLVDMGFMEKLEMLERDVDLDVRDRAKTALWQLRQSATTGGPLRNME